MLAGCVLMSPRPRQLPQPLLDAHGLRRLSIVVVVIEEPLHLAGLAQRSRRCYFRNAGLGVF
jgi:hypothetical protein